MKYTVRFAHMDNHPKWNPGDTIKRGDIVGVMGDSGTGTAAHLHIDCVFGEVKNHFSLNDMTSGKPKPCKRQLDFFIDNELFGTIPVITTKYDDMEYYNTYGKHHPAYDVVPNDRHKTKEHFPIHWNRSMIGTVCRVESNDPGYGNCVYASFEA